MYQHIVMSEMLPRLLGRSNKFLQRYRLLPGPEPVPSRVYRRHSNAQILQEFMGAAFRVGHTFVPELLVLSDSELRPLATVDLFKVFNDPSKMQETMQASAELRGVCWQYFMYC